MFGVQAYWQQDINGFTTGLNTNIKSPYVTYFDNHFYFCSGNNDNWHAGQLDINSNEIWNYTEPITELNIRNYPLLTHAGNQCVVNSHRGRYIGPTPWGDNYELFGIKTTLLDKSGNYMD